MHVFFDLDGTLTDPKIGITRSVAFALKKLDLPIPTLRDLEWVIGPALIESFQKLGVKDADLALSYYRTRYAETGLFENSLYPDIRDTLRDLRNLGCTLYLATAKPHYFARQITRHFGLSQYFTDEYGPEMDGTRNNKGELLAYALKDQKIGAKNCVMVGDRIHDFEAARFVGMPCIGVTWGYGSEVETDQADFVCANPNELLPVISKITGRDGL